MYEIASFMARRRRRKRILGRFHLGAAGLGVLLPLSEASAATLMGGPSVRVDPNLQVEIE